MNEKILIIIPAYNEEASILKLVKKFMNIIQNIKLIMIFWL